MKRPSRAKPNGGDLVHPLRFSTAVRACPARVRTKETLGFQATEGRVDRAHRDVPIRLRFEEALDRDGVQRSLERAQRQKRELLEFP